MFLGPDVVGESYPRFAERYVETLSDMIGGVLRTGAGEVAVVRLLCMPFGMIFAEDFDAASFAAKHQLNQERCKGAPSS